MAKRDVEGEIDAGYTSYWNEETAKQHGETVAVTDSNGSGEESTTMLPDHINPSERTDKQLAILKAAATHRDGTYQSIAKQADSSQQYASTVLSQHWPGHPVNDHEWTTDTTTGDTHTSNDTTDTADEGESSETAEARLQDAIATIETLSRGTADENVEAALAEVLRVARGEQ